MRTVDVSKGEQVAIFNSIGIETGAVCNRSCFFCPVHGNDRPDEYLPRDLWTKMICELRDIKWRGCLSTYIYNEPLRDPRFYELVSYARMELPRVCIGIATNGDYIKDVGVLQKIFDSGVNQLQVNVYSASDGHENPVRRAHGEELAERRYQVLSSLRQELIDDGVVSAERDEVFTYIPPKIKTMRVERKFGIHGDSRRLSTYELQNRSGNAPWFQPATTEPLKKMCVRPFRFLNINWKGDALLCCNDYHGETNFGNVRDKSLVEIWNSMELHRYRAKLLRKERDMVLCDRCDYSGGYYQHNVNKVVGVE